MNLPNGTVTFLFTDIEGSAKLWEQSPEVMSSVLTCHDALLRQAVEMQGGLVFKTVGDGICAAFANAPEALAAALAAQEAIHSAGWPFALRVRMALHTGTAEQRDNDYFGATVNRVSRLLALGRGGQVLLSAATQELTRDGLPPQTILHDLGEVRLRDLTRTEHVFQLRHPSLPADFPPLESLENSPSRNNLPQQVTSLVGRKKESAEVLQMLQASRLITLTGAGGCGKTRLALQAAANLQADYPEGVWFVELAPLTNSVLIPQTIAHILHVQEEAGKPLLQTLTERLKLKKMVLVLDNCEHLLAAVAGAAAALLRAVPQLRILATSREPLAVSGETVYRIPSLTLPDPGQTHTPESLLRFESVQLFLDRARAAAPAVAITGANAAALASICLRLDGIPLALELAAVRSRSLPLEQIAIRLDNCFQLLTGGCRAALPRQQTLRALIDWSYALLTEAEQDLFCRLSVFAGGWTLEAAEAVCSSESLPEGKILDGLISLVDKSLVVYAEQEGTARYRLLETIRQYAGDRLTERSEMEALRVRHRDYYLTLARHSFPQGEDALHALAVLKREHDNLRAALSASFDSPESVEQRLESLRNISVFRRIRGYYSEARDSLQAALAAEGKGRTAARETALRCAASINMALGNYDEARRQSEESVAIQREWNDPLKLADALMHHSNLFVDMGDFTAGRQILEEGLAIHLAHGGSGMGFYGNLGNVLIYLGEYDQAEKMETKHLTLCRQAGMREWEAVGLYNMGRIALVRANDTNAQAYFRQSLGICRDLDYRPGLLCAFFGLSLLAAAVHQMERACRLLGAHDALNERIGTRIFPADKPDYDRHSNGLCVTLGTKAFRIAYEAGRTLDWPQAIALAGQGLLPGYKPVFPCFDVH